MSQNQLTVLTTRVKLAALILQKLRSSASQLFGLALLQSSTVCYIAVLTNYARLLKTADLIPCSREQFVDDIIARLLAFKPEVAQLLDSLEERVYFTKRRVSRRAVTFTTPYILGACMATRVG